MSEKKKIVVLGGGLAGLSAAWKLSEAGHEVTVVEKENYVGGMSATIKKHNYLFDFGGHRFITKRKDVIEEIKKLMGKDFRPGYRQTQYLLWGKRLKYPLELGDLIRKVSPFISAKCLIDYLWTSVKGKFVSLPEDNFESWVSKRFGKHLYDIFFGQYTAKIWGMPPSRLSRDWAAQRISILNLADAVKQLLFKPKEDPRTYTRKYYYCNQGIGQIADKMAQEIKKKKGKILLQSEPKKISVKNNIVQSVDVGTNDGIKKITCDYLINTIPVTDTVALLNSPAPASILSAAKKLRYRAISFLFLALDQERASDNDALYVPEPKYFFFRIEQYKFWSMKMVPSHDKTSLCLEVGCFKDDEVWNMSDEELYQKGIEGLMEAKLIKDESVVAGYFVRRLDYVYPVFEIGYEKHAKKVREYVDSVENLISYGRQGYFQYIHMHHVIAKGFQAADHIINGSPKSLIQKLGMEEEYFG